MRRLLGAGRPPDTVDGRGAPQWTAINACLVPAAALDGQEVVTAEGLGTPDDLHPVQREMAVRGGSQCGYCTPGFVCSMAAEYYRARPGRRRLRPERRPRARPERLRPARAERQPVPLHRLPPDPRRRLGARAPRPPTTRSPPGSHDRRRRRRRDPARRRATASSPGRPTSPRRWRCSPSTPTRSSSPAAPTGASRSTCAARGRRTVVAVDRLPELRGCRGRATTTVTHRRGADPDRGRGGGWTGRCRCSTRCGRSSRRG